MGQVAPPVIGYHAFGGPPEFAGGPRYDRHGLNIPPAVFRSQLNLMRSRGFWPQNMRDVVQGRMSLPPGKRPIVLTFDDGRATQFRYLKNGKIDPDCAVGILLEFHRLHPDWPLRGSFYLIAGSDANGVPFDQEGFEARKIRQLLHWGFEIGNHSLTHPSFKSLSRRRIVKEIAGADAYLKALVPGIEVNTFALPYGDLPKVPSKWPLLNQGKFHGHVYHNIGILLFSSHQDQLPSPAPFNPNAINRIAPAPGVVERMLKSQTRPPKHQAPSPNP